MFNFVVVPETFSIFPFLAVAVRKIVAEEHHGIPHAFNSETPSLASGYTGRSSATGTGRGSSRASSRGTSKSTGHGGNNAVDSTGKIIELDEDGEEFGTFGSTGYMFDMLQKSVRFSNLLFYVSMCETPFNVYK